MEVEMLEKCTALWREAHSEVKMLKTHQVRNTFETSDVEKVRAVAARSAFGSQNDKSSVGALLEVELLKKCTPLWRQAHFEINM